ncbi:ubiquitin-specific protease otu1 [Tilletia horrida]|nr:ubiquitin-specific protease otu1 [Tilletia horrida]
MIRIRHPGGATTVKVENATTIAQLQLLIHSATDIAAHQQDIKTGFPPKSIDLSTVASDAPISSPSVGIRAGDQLIIARSDRPAPSAGEQLAQQSYASTLASSASTSASVSKPSASSSQSTAPASSITAPASTPAANQPAGPASVPQPRLSRKQPQVTDGEVFVEVQGGFGSLVLRVTEDDNSCLFHAFSFAQRQVMGEEAAFKLRERVAQTIMQDEEYSDVILGYPREEYIHRILSPQTWGGAIELSVLSKSFHVLINAIDVRTGVVHRFGEGEGYPHACYLIYSGIHYDVLALLPFPGAPAEYSTTLFEANSPPIEEAAQRLVAELKQRNFTDTANFAIRCGQCGQKLTGEKAAQQHAQTTGHTDFRELDD